MTAIKAKPKRYACAICGHPGKAEAMIYSRFTHNRYCRDDRACDRRMLRKHRARKTSTSDGASP